MQLSSVNLGQARPLGEEASGPRTGIFKIPSPAPVQVTARGLAGDAICDRRHHGGKDQAVYLYGEPDYAWWSALLGQPVAPGTFGENLTLTGLESAACSIGDRFQIGDVLLEVTAPRIPCATLARRMGDPEFVGKFRDAERPGLYCRVLQEGAVQAGDPVAFVPCSSETVGVLEIFRDFYAPDKSEAAIQRILAAPIAHRLRFRKQRQLWQAAATARARASRSA